MITIEQKIWHLESLIYEDEQSKWLAGIKDLPIADVKTQLEALKTTKANLESSIANLKEQANE